MVLNAKYQINVNNNVMNTKYLCRRKSFTLYYVDLQTISSFKTIKQAILLSRNDYLWIKYADKIAYVAFKLNYDVPVYLWLWQVSGYISLRRRGRQHSNISECFSTIQILPRGYHYLRRTFHMVCKYHLLFHTFCAKKRR